MTFRPDSNAVAWRDALSRFLHNPTKHSLNDTDLNVVSVAFIVNEALRLYPSTKSVYRAFHMASKAKPELVVANVQQCHRTVGIWEPDPRRFMPERWYSVTEEQKRAYMPFGGGLFVCPAKAEYGPMIVGVLVAALAGRIVSGEWTLLLYRGGADVGSELGAEEELEAERKAYGRMEIVRKTG